ncbi:MAG TPA: hypothetical protein VM640_06540 [Desulfitobacterium sp.]|nr:hypothetical protein [Desulfitobacterium sp.]
MNANWHRFEIASFNFLVPQDGLSNDERGHGQIMICVKRQEILAENG